MEAVILEEVTEAGVIVVNGRSFMINAKGGYDPIDTVKDQFKLEDQTVRKCIGFAIAASEQMSRLKAHTFADLAALDELLGEQYGVKIGGKKGNRTYQTYDGLMKVQVQVQDLISFGPELQIAKQLIDLCLIEWSAESRPEIQTIVTKAFNTDKEGQVNRGDLYMLQRLEIKDERWQRAMTAINDAIRVTGSKEYIRFYHRKRQEDEWLAITTDMAKA